MEAWKPSKRRKTEASGPGFDDVPGPWQGKRPSYGEERLVRFPIGSYARARARGRVEISWSYPL